MTVTLSEIQEKIIKFKRGIQTLERVGLEGVLCLEGVCWRLLSPAGAAAAVEHGNPWLERVVLMNEWNQKEMTKKNNTTRITLEFNTIQQNIAHFSVMNALHHIWQRTRKHSAFFFTKLANEKRFHKYICIPLASWQGKWSQWGRQAKQSTRSRGHSLTWEVGRIPDLLTVVLNPPFSFSANPSLKSGRLLTFPLLMSLKALLYCSMVLVTSFWLSWISDSLLRA